MSDPLAQIKTRNAVMPQSEQADERQVLNNAGGYTFEVSEIARVRRFLTIGTEGGTYYQSEKDYTRDNAKFILDFAKRNGTALVNEILSVSEEGRAHRQNPSLFAFAVIYAFGDAESRQLAKKAFNRVVRTGSHLFTFCKYAENLSGWIPTLRSSVASWYTSRDAQELSYQMIKYRQREDFTHRDVLRLSHANTTDPDKRALFDWACGRDSVFGWAAVYEAAQLAGGVEGHKKSVFADLIRSNPGLPWEALPDIALTYPATWEALLDAGMPMTALIRQLPRLTNLGLLKDSKRLAKVAAQLTDPDALRKARIHPVAVLYALKTYASGRSAKGKGSWIPVQGIVDALDASFYTSFGTVAPAGKRTLLALDVSGSMSWGGNGILTPAEGSCAMAMVTAATEPACQVMGFASEFRELPVSPRRRLDDNLRSIRNLSFGGTDCSLPMTWAAQNNLEFDTFSVYTDNETWAGRVHPHQALRDYRRKSGIDARLVVVGMTATNFTIADPKDPGMLDVAGFDAGTPAVISGFSRGDFS